MRFYCDTNTITSKSIFYHLYNFEKIKSMFYSAALIKCHQLGDFQKKKKSPLPTVLEARKLKTGVLYLHFLEKTYLSKATVFGDSFMKTLGLAPFHNTYVFMDWSVLKDPSF